MPDAMLDFPATIYPCQQRAGFYHTRIVDFNSINPHVAAHAAAAAARQAQNRCFMLLAVDVASEIIQDL